MTTRYIRDPALNLYRRRDFAGIPYSDGEDAERRVHDVVRKANDRSVFSAEMWSGITDWPSEYHLSRQRHCLLRPLGIAPGDKVLEVGCGCGAITRFLGELGAEVVGVEGNPSRAEIAGERCRDLPNVRIVADDLLQLELDEQFDWVLLIGVLEYAPVFSPHHNPVLHYLNAVARFLEPRGRLVVAIENKLGIKYFNCCAEDHIGVPFYGVQGLYGPRTPRTFGKRELEDQFRAVGLSRLEFYYPFPDYKLPRVILSDAALRTPQFNAADLLAFAHARDYGGISHRLFDEPLALREIARNGLLGDLSNSFLVVATRKAQRRSHDLLAVAYATSRAPEFATQTRFVRSGEAIRVLKEPLFRDMPRERPFGDTTLRQAIGEADYVSGSLASWRLSAARARGAELEQVVDALAPWFDFLLQQAMRDPAPEAGARGGGGDLSRYWLTGEKIDLTPFNLIEAEDGFWPIDQEWRIDQSIPLGWVVTRAVLWSLITSPGFEARELKIAEVIRRLCARHDLAITDTDVAEWLDLEHRLQVAVTGRNHPPMPATVGSHRLIPLHLLPAERDAAVAALEQARTQGDQLVAERDGQIASFTQALAERDGQIASFHQTIADREAAVAQRDGTIAELQQVVWAREDAVTALQGAVAVKDGEIAILHQTIADCEAALAQRDGTIAELRQGAGAREDEVTTLQETVAAKDGEMGILYQTITDREAALAARDRSISGLQAMVHALHASASWRITVPLRLAKRSLRQMSFGIVGYGAVQVLRCFRSWLFAPLCRWRAVHRIVGSCLFDREWYLRTYPDVAAAGIDPIVHYLEFGAAECRDPNPAFSSRGYLENNPDVAASDVNPFLHFILHGQSEGRADKPPVSPITESFPVPAVAQPNHISPPLGADYSIAVPLGYPSPSRVAAPGLAVICHVFYEELTSELHRYFQSIPFRFDLFISTDTPAKEAHIRRCFSDRRGGAAEIRLFENRGRDIAAKLIGFADVHRRYRYVLHVHSKRAVHEREFLLTNLLGSQEIVSSIFDIFARHPSIGLIASQRFESSCRRVDWSDNFPMASALADRMGVKLAPDQHLDFPAGSMFWARSAALKPLLDLELCVEDFPVECGQVDGTIAHAIKRLYYFICERAGYNWIKIAHPLLLKNKSALVPINNPPALTQFMKGNLAKVITNCPPL